jgi:hypothetical protein
MIMGEFGGKLRSGSPVGSVNEAVRKVLRHNLCVLVHGTYA